MTPWRHRATCPFLLLSGSLASWLAIHLHRNSALVFVACNALVAIVSYLLIVGEIKRVQLKSA